MAQDSRQAGATYKTSETVAGEAVSRQMVSAGVAALERLRETFPAEELVLSIYTAMAAARMPSTSDIARS